MSDSSVCAPNNERGEVLSAVMRHCRDMKRQETRSRWATGFLLLALCATFVWLQFSAHTRKDVSTKEESPQMGANHGGKNQGKRKDTIELMSPAPGTEQVNNWTDMRNQQHVLRWNTQYVDSVFKLEDNSTKVEILSKGWHMINLIIPYTVHANWSCNVRGCFEEKFCILSATVFQESDGYPKWKKLIEGRETVQCSTYWTQTIRLNRVVSLQKSDKLIVAINKEQDTLRYDYAYFYVTRL